MRHVSANKDGKVTKPTQLDEFQEYCTSLGMSTEHWICVVDHATNALNIGGEAEEDVRMGCGSHKRRNTAKAAEKAVSLFLHGECKEEPLQQAFRTYTTAYDSSSTSSSSTSSGDQRWVGRHQPRVDKASPPLSFGCHPPISVFRFQWNPGIHSV